MRLVDTGRVTTVLGRQGWDYIRLCPRQFLTSSALSFSCHLQSVQFIGNLLTDEVIEQIKSPLPNNNLVDLQMYRNGGPVQKRFRDEETEVEYELYSLPVELTWKDESSDDPFLPMKVLFYSLTDLFLDHLGIAHDGIDKTTDLLDEEDFIEEIPTEKEFPNALPMTVEDSTMFEWLPPELPQKTSFSARGIFVDQSGQIYIQLASLKFTIAALRRLLDEKFMNSLPDEDVRPMVEGQACCVKWRDGSWFRGRFLNYIDSSKKSGHFLLVDYGNIFVANIKEDVRREIYAEKVPILALRVELGGVTPRSPWKTWTPECLDIIQDQINYERNDHKRRKLRVKILDVSNKLPLKVSIKFELENTKIDLASFLAYHHHVDLRSNDEPSEEFCDIREQMEFGIQAVPHGTYKEKNFYVMLHEINNNIVYCDKDQGNQLLHIDWSLTGLKIGDVLEAEVMEIVDCKTVFLHPADQNNEYLANIVENYENMFAQVQSECDKGPPVFQPSIGLQVCAKYRQEGWFRAIVTSYSESDITVEFLDYGNRCRITDTLKIKEMPDEFANISVIAIKLSLNIKVMENEDIVHALLLETLKSTDDKVGIVITRFGENGSVHGHLIDIKSGDCLYKGLENEGLVRII